MTALTTAALQAAQFDRDLQHLKDEWTGVEWDVLQNAWAIYRHGWTIGWAPSREAAWDRLREIDPHLRAA